MSAFVTDFNACIALCSNWNYWQPDGQQCTSVAWNVNGSASNNCWGKNGTRWKVSDEVVAAAIIDSALG